MTEMPEDIVVAFELNELERYDCVCCAMVIECLRAGRPVSDDLVVFPAECAVRTGGRRGIGGSPTNG